MPVEIRELVIRATIVDEHQPPAVEPQPQDHPVEDVVSECVEQIVQILKSKTER